MTETSSWERARQGEITIIGFVNCRLEAVKQTVCLYVSLAQTVTHGCDEFQHKLCSLPKSYCDLQRIGVWQYNYFVK